MYYAMKHGEYTHHGAYGLPDLIGNIVGKFKNFKDKIISSLINYLLDKLYCSFEEIIELTESYMELQKELQNDGLVVAFISFMVFHGNVKSIVLKRGDDEYPEVRIKPTYKISSKELVSKLKEISKIRWNISDSEDRLLLVSVIIDR
jgi:hypothetical protein